MWWITAEQPELVGGQFMALAESLGCVQAGDILTDAARQAALGELRRRERWLLVFDNAEGPEHLAGWLPGVGGHVLITSRTPAVGDRGASGDRRAGPCQSVIILRDRGPWLTDADADQVAEAMGDLPLGVVQAAGYMTDTGTGAAQYLSLLKTRAENIMDQADRRHTPVVGSRDLAGVRASVPDRVQLPRGAEGGGLLLLSLATPAQELCPILGAEWERRDAFRRGQMGSPCPAGRL